MMPRLLTLVLMLLSAFGVGHVSSSAWADAPGQNTSHEPVRVMMMLKLGAEHYRSGSDYGGSYGDSMGQAARLRFARKIARDHNLKIVDTWPMPVVGVDCIVLEIPDGRSQEQVVAELSGVPGVSWSQPLNEFRMLGADPPQGSLQPSFPNYNDRLLATQPAASFWHLARLHSVATGKGVSIAIIDSKVDLTHRDLVGQIAQSIDFVAGHPDAERHGTGVAGIIVARPNNAMGIVGIAPEAKVTALRACWEKGKGGATVCDSLSLARALTYAIEHKSGIVNLSLSGPRDPLISKLIDIATGRGAIVVAAIDPVSPASSFPALLPRVISVGDERLSGRVRIAYIAPGQNVPTTEPEGKWDLVSGSSFAAAHVSGLFALLRQASGQRASAEAILGPPGTIDACAALSRVSRLDKRACVR